jgi:chromosome segregation protein
MRFERLRLAGFKSFVEPADVMIEPGLTGIVGPNGCGKSNLTEALRWVMGESSTKNMRAGGMEDVIFGGTTARPARNNADVTLWLDNRARTAPAAFNDADRLEVTRHIARDQGSTYRVNGREVRARDVQLLFADASTGARSPSLVRQGHISEIIAAKPTARRRLLEEAAGISGLHARRQESETRLAAAETNLSRLDDVMRQIAGQLDALKRQAKQAVRYRSLSAEIREAEALLARGRYAEAGRLVAEASSALAAATVATTEAAARQSDGATAQAVAAHAVPNLREAEARAAAVLQRLASARDQLDQEEKRARDRAVELEKRIAQLQADAAREESLAGETDAALARLAQEDAGLAAEEAGAGAIEQTAEAEVDRASRDLAALEAALTRATDDLAQANARRAQLERTIRDTSERLVRLAGQTGEIESEAEALRAKLAADGEVEPLRAAVQAAKGVLMEAEVALSQAEAGERAARSAENAGRPALAEAERKAQRLETEAATLKRLLSQGVSGRWRPVLDEVTVAPGFEAALGAALGDDLDLSTEAGAPQRWAGADVAASDPPLPAGADAITAHVSAPPALARRLAQIGVVSDDATGEALAASLAPGQRLVTRAGRLWRWDGMVAAAGAPSAAARRLAEKNRLSEMEAAAATARTERDAARKKVDALLAATRTATEAHEAARQRQRFAQSAVTTAQDRLAGAERATAAVSARLSALEEARVRLAASLSEAEAVKHEALTALDGLPDRRVLEEALGRLRVETAESRAGFAEAKSRHQSLAREREGRARRRAAIASESAGWIARREKSATHRETIAARVAEAAAERDGLDGLPGELREKRLALLAEIDRAEAARRAAADRLAEGEVKLADADRAAREAAAALSAAREAAARAEARLEAAQARKDDIARAILESLDTPADELTRAFDLPPLDQAPEPAVLEGKLDALRRERERMGAVNLRADTEAEEIETRLAGLDHERTDLEEAIRRLRAAIGNLNREARERLTDAFGKVAAHFAHLFTTLFGGGEAELILTESEDPLAAGLDVVARPPGKRPQSLSLLSGGEQALTATALIFAVFLTNPAPICVLDEVDAPLDDHNVERYCALLVEMAKSTETRFLVITHNPITMARMHRLFGVTMAERGVSTLVSVDLETAERLVEAA